MKHHSYKDKNPELFNRVSGGMAAEDPAADRAAMVKKVLKGKVAGKFDSPASYFKKNKVRQEHS